MQKRSWAMRASVTVKQTFSTAEELSGRRKHVWKREFKQNHKSGPHKVVFSYHLVWYSSGSDFSSQCWSRPHRLLHRAGCHVGHGGVWRCGGHLQLRENPLLPAHQHDPDRGQDKCAARNPPFSHKSHIFIVRFLNVLVWRFRGFCVWGCVLTPYYADLTLT